MRINRGLLFWGLALVTAGIVALGVQQGYLDESILGGAWRLWPVILIAIGLSIILSRTAFGVLGTVVAAVVVGVVAGSVLAAGPFVTGCAGGDVESAALTPSSGAFEADAVQVDLDFSCGSLALAMGDAASWSANVGRTRGPLAEVTGDAGSLRISTEGGSMFDAGGQRWVVTLGADPTYELTASINAASSTMDLTDAAFAAMNLEPNAGDITVNLSGATVENLDVGLNAGNASITVDEGSSVSGSLETNAGSLELCATPGTAVRISLESNVAFGHNLGDSDLVRSRDTWTSEGFETAETKVDLRLSGNAGSFNLNPEDGCA